MHRGASSKLKLGSKVLCIGNGLIRNRYLFNMANKYAATTGYKLRKEHLKGHIEVQINDDQSETAILPGFSYGDLDRTGDVELWRVLTLLQSGLDNCSFRAVPKEGKNGLGLAELLKEKFNYVISNDLSITKEFYTKKEDFLYEPVLYKQYLNKVGSTSVNFIAEAHCQKGFLLARLACVLVFVNKDTHVPVKHPQDYLAKFGDVKPKLKFDNLRKSEKPNDAFRTSCRVVWSDINFLNHCSHLSYVRYALDAATEACFTGHFHSLHQGDLVHNKVRRMNMLYSGQLKAGDNVDAYVWEDRAEPRRVHCQLEKNGQSVFNTAIDFFGPSFTETKDVITTKL